MPKNALPRSNPEQQGVPSQAILAFVNRAEREIHELHSFVLLRHGAVIAEGWWSPYAAHRPHTLFSLTKSFTSTAVGLAITEGRLNLDDPVVSFFPEYVPADASPNLKAMRVRHLLTMSTGHTSDTTDGMMLQPEGNWVKGFLSLPVEHEPGAPFVYNSGASYMLSAIVQKVTGMPLQDYLQPRLFAPLGIQDPAWLKCPRGVNIGGWGLSLTSEEIARFGQLYLQQGQWHGKQILPETWVAAATTKQVSNGSNPDNDWEQGYGFQFWRCRHGGYRGDGAFGQFCIVLPDQDAVLAITSGLDELQPVLDLVWETLLPAFSAGSLPPDAAAQPELSRRLAGLAYLPPHGGATSPLAAGFAGKTFPLGGNDLGADAAEFEFSAENGAVSFRVKGAWHRLAYDAGQWLEGTTLLFGNHAQKVLASGVWAQPDSLEITARLVETPFCFTLRCAFKDGHLNLSWQPNVKLDDRLMSHLFESTLNG